MKAVSFGKKTLQTPEVGNVFCSIVTLRDLELKVQAFRAWDLGFMFSDLGSNV